MKTLFAFFFVLLLSASLAFAASVAINKIDYVHNDLVTVNVACTGDWLAQIRSSDSQLVHIEQGQNSRSFIYNTLSSSASGKYSVSVSCQDGNTVTTNFCVDANGCAFVAPVGGQPGGNDGGNTPGPSNSGGGSGTCQPQWSCNAWSYCNSTLQQSHTCFDNRSCKTPMTEVRSCAVCQESWTCSLWSGCFSGIQNRACVDEHYCGAVISKPTLQKSCSDSFALGPDPAQIINLPPEQFTKEFPLADIPPVVQQPQSDTTTITSIWDQYKIWFIGGGSFFLLAIIIITVILVLHKPKEKAYNFDELKEWIKKEREMGTSDADVKQILKEQTGWREDEIVNAFKELRSSSV